jgi:hypothetical protein
MCFSCWFYLSATQFMTVNAFVSWMFGWRPLCISIYVLTHARKWEAVCVCACVRACARAHEREKERDWCKCNILDLLCVWRALNCNDAEEQKVIYRGFPRSLKANGCITLKQAITVDFQIVNYSPFLSHIIQHGLDYVCMWNKTVE